MERPQILQCLYDWAHDEFFDRRHADKLVCRAAKVLPNFPSVRILIGEELVAEEAPYWVQVIGGDIVFQKLPVGVPTGITLKPDECCLIPSDLMPLRPLYPKRNKVKLEATNIINSMLPGKRRRLMMHFRTSQANYERHSTKLRIIVTLGKQSIIYSLNLSEASRWSNEKFCYEMNLVDPAFSQFHGVGLMVFQLAELGHETGELEAVSNICPQHQILGINPK